MPLKGTLPTTWGSPTAFQQLQQLTLSGMHNITGSYPASWQQSVAFPGLQSMDLGNNSLTGYLPEALPFQLENLSLSSNNFLGPLPAAWAQPNRLPMLQNLYLASNRLSGRLLGHWPSALQTLQLWNNYFSGPLPTSGWPKQLQGLDLSYNRLSSTVPAALSLSSTVPDVDTASSNTTKASHTVPASWASLQQLDLSGNLFDGTLPESWALMTQLQTLVVTNNKFTGTVSSRQWHPPTMAMLAKELSVTVINKVPDHYHQSLYHKQS